MEFRNEPRIHFCEPGWSWSPAPLPDTDCWCVLGGQGQVNLGRDTHLLHTGVCFLFGPGTRPVAKHDPATPLTVFAVHVDIPPDRKSAPPVSGLPPRNLPIQVTDTQRLRRLCELLTDSAPLDSDFKREEASLAFRQLLHLLAHPQARQAPADPRLERLRRQLHERLGQPWTVEEMARVAALSPSRFNVLFKSQFGRTPVHYLIHARIDRAKALLLETRMTQAEVADALGYSDVYFFHRQFRKFTGFPPGRIRDGA
jgi:AraC-like DNA-binding protein